jgi:hypothetical protein
LRTSKFRNTAVPAFPSTTDTYSKGGFANIQATNINIESSQFSNGFGIFGGAISIMPIESFSVDIKDCAFTGNTAQTNSPKGLGGAIYFDLSNVITGTITIGNPSG